MAHCLNLLTRYAPTDGVNIMTLEASPHLYIPPHHLMCGPEIFSSAVTPKNL
jgi:hypothetical protein